MYDEKMQKYDGDITPRAKNAKKISCPIITGEESKTQQHFKDSCDINKMIGNPEAHANPNQEPRFGDFSNMMDLAGSMQKAIDARNLFDSLPVDLRKRVGHSVEGLFNLIDDAQKDPAIKEECYKWGLFTRPEPEPAVPTVRIEGFSPESKKDGSLKKTKISSDE